MPQHVFTRCRMASAYLALTGLTAIPASGAPIPLTSFDDLMGNPSGGTRTIQMAVGDNLMFDDGVTIQSVGLDGTTWHMGFVDYDSGNAYIVGWAKNPLPTFPGWQGWFQGKYSSDLQYDEDQTPDDVFVVQDVLDDGIGVLDSGAWILGPDDVFYTAEDILFGLAQIRGDVSQLPSWSDVGPGGSSLLPSMTISVLQVFAGDLNGDGFVGLGDLDIVLGRWNQDVAAGVWAEGDPSGDGYVGLTDLDTVLSNWNAGTPPAAEATAAIPEPASVLLLMASGGLLGVRRHRR